MSSASLNGVVICCGDMYRCGMPTAMQVMLRHFPRAWRPLVSMEQYKSQSPVCWVCQLCTSCRTDCLYGNIYVTVAIVSPLSFLFATLLITSYSWRSWQPLTYLPKILCWSYPGALGKRFSYQTVVVTLHKNIINETQNNLKFLAGVDE